MAIPKTQTKINGKNGNGTLLAENFKLFKLKCGTEKIETRKGNNF